MDGERARFDDVDPDAGFDADAPICWACGVTALPDGDGFVCANPDCDGEGEPVT